MNPSTAPVVFVCTGNICRSPLAERLAAHLDPHTSFASAGTHAMVGSDMDAGMAAELSRLGGDPSDFSPRLIDAQMAGSARLLIALTRSHRDFITGAFPAAGSTTVVLKPYARWVRAGFVRPWDAPSPQVLSDTRAQAAVTGTFDDDVADPYRMGWQEARRAADEIDEAIRTILGLSG